MSVSGRFEITITANTQEELDKIAEAIYNGFAENVLKERILWAQYTPSNVTVKKEDATKELVRLESKASNSVVPPVVNPPKAERPRGILGRKPFGRSDK